MTNVQTRTRAPVGPRRGKSNGGGQSCPELNTHRVSSAPQLPHDGSRGDALSIRDHLSLSSLIHEIRHAYAVFSDIQSAKVRLELQCQAICRRICGSDKAEGKNLYLAVRNGADHELKIAAVLYIKPLLQPLMLLEADTAAAEKTLKLLARKLPVWERWCKGVRGVAENSLGKIVGEAGDLGNYPTPSHLWKRMGLAVIDGERQRNFAGTSEEQKLKNKSHGYVARRRAVMAVIGENMIRARSEYKTVYDERKTYEIGRVDLLIHAHKRALRYMEKRFLRDLWNEWRKA